MAHAEFSNIHEARQALTDLHAAAEGRELTDDEQQGWDTAQAFIDRAQARMAEVLRLAKTPGHVERGSDPAPNRTRGDSPGGELRDGAMRTLDTLTSRSLLPSYAADRVESLLATGSERSRSLAARWAAATGNLDYAGAFAKLCADPQRGHMRWTEAEAAAYRAVQAVADELRAGPMGTGAGIGGEMIPLTLDPAIMLTNDGSNNPLRQLARVVRTTTNAWQGVTSAGTTAEWKAEHAEASAAEVALDDPSIPVHLGDVDVLYSYEVGMDAVDFLGQLQMVIMDAADQLQATAYTTGTGTGQPRGIVTAIAAVPGSVIAGAGAEVLDSADPYNLVNSLGPRFSSNAQFVSHIATANTLRQMETANGSLKFPELRNNPPQLIGKRWTELSNMDGAVNPAATGSNYVLLYGDFKSFVIVDRIGATLEILPGYGANRRPTAQRHAFLTFRTGSDVVVPQAFRLLNVATTA